MVPAQGGLEDPEALVLMVQEDPEDLEDTTNTDSRHSIQYSMDSKSKCSISLF